MQAPGSFSPNELVLCAGSERSVLLRASDAALHEALCSMPQGE